MHFVPATSGCAQEPCMFGRCEYKSSSPFCLCDRGFTGERCDMRINFCKDIQCTQNARCVSSLDGYYCECNPGFTGQQCETYYVGACRFPEVCINGGTCVVKGDTFQCQCLPSFTGETCEIEVISTPEREAEHNKKGLPNRSVDTVDKFRSGRQHESIRYW
uniref:EGF-like domain-containing protein n=1 Tax=Trichuris muris TaxID=70415 RepID=A0A5S6Q328_TRIMR